MKRRLRKKTNMTKTCYIDLLRHGETENSDRFNGSTDNPLTDQGWKQMWASVEKTPMQWQNIVTSPLTRCTQFAQQLSEHLAIPVTQDEGIQEIHFGDWEGCSAKELLQTDADALSRFWTNPLQNPPPHAEHLLDFQKRVLSAWNKINTQFAGMNTLLVTHNGVIRTLLCHIQQHPIERLMEFEVEYAALKRIQMTKNDNKWHATLTSS